MGREREPGDAEREAGEVAARRGAHELAEGEAEVRLLVPRHLVQAGEPPPRGHARETRRRAETPEAEPRMVRGEVQHPARGESGERRPEADEARPESEEAATLPRRQVVRDEAAPGRGAPGGARRRAARSRR